MIFRGKIKGVIDNQIVIEVEDYDIVNNFTDLIGQYLKFDTKKWRTNRTLEQNALYWACVHEIAKAITVDIESIHLNFLKQTQKPTTIECVKESLKDFKRVFRLCEVVDETETTYIVNCYKGTEYMDTEEFGFLLDLVIAEMKEIGIQPLSREMKRLLDEIL